MPLFIPITKVDTAQRLVYGTLSEEVPDKAGEILDYATAKPAFMEWTRQFQEASGGKSLGNVREMHGSSAAGKLTNISFDDEHRRIEGVAKIIDDDAWTKVLEGVYTGFSIGGGYVRRWPDPENPALMRYTPTLSEVSLVDNPAVPTATFSLIKQDGSVEQKSFVPHSTYAEPAAMQKIAQLGDKVEALARRVAELEASPMLPKGALRAVRKTDDYPSGDDETLKHLPEEQRAQWLMKLALANPQVF